MESQNKKVSWKFLVLGILFVIAALLSFSSTVYENLAVLVTVIAVFAIIKGFHSIFIRSEVKSYLNIPLTSLLLLGIFDILVGVFLFVNQTAGIVALPIVFAVWIIVDAVFGLAMSGSANFFGPGYLAFATVVNILSLILGIAMLFNTAVAALTLSFLLGFYLMLAGMLCIIQAFLHPFAVE